MPKVIIDLARCKACGLCVAFCPKDNIRIGEEVDERGYHFAVVCEQDACTGCKMCAVMCPEGGITIYRERSAAVSGDKAAKKDDEL
jgi:2-oxoglutarate ferredoxin oxidoreductase subunit delta